MNAIVTIANNLAVTMTSLELVEFINSQRAEGEAVLAHSDFLKKVPQVLGAEVAGNFSGYYKASNGKQNPMYTFPKREACLMAMSYSYDLQAKVFDRMTALEAQAAKPALNPANLSRLQLIEMAMQAEQERLALEEKKSALEEKVAEQAPKVAFAHQVEVAPDAIDMAKAAKLLGTGRNRFMSFLREIQWISRYNQPYQDKIEAGLLDVKLGSWDHPEHGLQQSVTALVTGKGLVKLQRLWKDRQQAISEAGMMIPKQCPQEMHHAR